VAKLRKLWLSKGMNREKGGKEEKMVAKIERWVAK
jgi:hypothetical protein